MGPITALILWYVFCGTSFVLAFRTVFWAVPAPLLLIMGYSLWLQHELATGTDYAGLGPFLVGIACLILMAVALAAAIAAYLLTSSTSRRYRGRMTAPICLLAGLIVVAFAAKLAGL